jgi:NAD(P)-dependent dehydrogenase (short-subunit alcohol dehydrogenase family)
LDVDLKGVFFCCQAASPQMIKQKYGKIVNISSALGTGATPHKRPDQLVRRYHYQRLDYTACRAALF